MKGGCIRFNFKLPSAQLLTLFLRKGPSDTRQICCLQTIRGGGSFCPGLSPHFSHSHLSQLCFLAYLPSPFPPSSHLNYNLCWEGSLSNVYSVGTHNLSCLLTLLYPLFLSFGKELEPIHQFMFYQSFKMSISCQISLNLIYFSLSHNQT